jgi:hypothetical protein
MKALLVTILCVAIALALAALLAAPPGRPANLAYLATPTACPSATPEPFWVDPVTSPTERLTQTVQVYLGNCEVVTVTTESGVFTATAPCYPAPALAAVSLQPNTTHHLLASGQVRLIEHDGCFYGGYTLWTDRDRFGEPLIITQVFTPTVILYLPWVGR